MAHMVFCTLPLDPGKLYLGTSVQLLTIMTAAGGGAHIIDRRDDPHVWGVCKTATERQVDAEVQVKGTNKGSDLGGMTIYDWKQHDRL